MISKIITENFMGAVGRVSTPVEKYTAFVGKNGAGKSTRLNAIIVTMQGYLSEAFGKQPTKTMELARADKMITGIELETGARYERVFERKGNSVSSYARIDGSDVAQREGDGIIKNDLGDFPVMFNLSEFEALSPDKKKQFLFSISGSINDIDNKGKFFGFLRYELMKQVLDEVTPNNLLEFKMGLKSFDELDESLYKEYFGVLNSQVDNDVVEYIDMLIEDFSEVFTSAPQVLFDTLLKKTSEEESFQRKTVRDTDATRTKLAEVSADLDGKKQELENVEGEILEHEELKEKVISKISANKTNRLRVEDHERMLGKLRLKVSNDEEFLELNKDMTNLIDSITILEKDVEAARDLRATNNHSLDVLYRDYNDLVEKMDALFADKQKLVVLVKSLSDVKGTCVVSELIPCNENFAKPISDAEQEIASLDKKIGPLKVEADELRKEIDSLVSTSNASDAMLSNMENTLGDKKREMELVESRRKSVLGTLESSKAEIEELELHKMPPVFDEVILDGELTGYRNRLIILNDRKTAINRQQATFNALNDTVLKARLSSEKLAVAIGLKKTIQNLRNQLLDTAIRPLVKSVAGLMQGIDPSFDVVFDMDPGFQVRVFMNNNWQPFSSLSGGERLIFMAGLLTAIIETGNPALKVLILEAAEVDRDNLDLVMRTIPSVTESLDNVLIAYPHADVSDVDGWMVNRV